MAKSDDKLRELESALAIDQHALDEALMTQPDAFYRVSREYVMLVAERDQAKQMLAEEEAAAARRVRKLVEKITVKELEEEVQLDKKVKAARATFAELAFQASQFGALKEAFMQRSYALKDLVELHLANYFADNAEKGRGGVNRAKDDLAERGRREMTRARRGS